MRAKWYILANITFVLIIVVGTILIYKLSDSIKQENVENRAIRLRAANQEASTKLKNSVVNFATLVSSYRSYILSSDTMPGVLASRRFFNQILSEIDYKEEVVVSFVDTAHVFQYTFTRNALDPSNLKGRCVKEFRDQEEIRDLNAVMTNDSLHLFEPLNLVEGWLGIPLNFRVVRNNQVMGYIAPIINFRTIIEPIYETDEIREEYVFQFNIKKNGNQFDRESVMDNTPIYNTHIDLENSSLFAVDSSDYVRNTISLYGLDIVVSTAYKKAAVQDNFQTYVLYIWFASLIGFAIIFYRKTLNREKLSKMLEKAFKELSYRNENVTRSINYAKRIQDSIIPEPSEITSKFGDAFILDLPKDIVSGDFYWYSENRRIKILALADCTGHGVPGAFMTLLGISFLNEIINVEGILDPGNILIRLQKKISESVRNTSIKSYDGMDIALLAIDEKEGKISFCGLGSSIFLISEGELIEKKGLIVGIGPFNDGFLKHLVVQEIDLKTTDAIYLGSDGFQDQIGHQSDRKFMKSRLKKLIQEHSHLEFKEQKERYEKAFLEWKGKKEQTDDVMLIGIKLNN